MKQKLIITLLTLATLLGAAALWVDSGRWVWSATLVASGLGLVLLVGAGGAWLRHRQRRRMMDMRDSALW